MTFRAKIFLGFFISVYFTFNLIAQQQKVDSLSAILATTQSPLEKAGAYVALSDLLFVQDIDTVIPLCEAALALIDNNSSDKSAVAKKVLGIKAAALNNIGYVYDTYGRTSKALSHYLQSLKIRQSAGDEKGTVESFNNIASVYKNQGDTGLALKYYKRGLKIAQNINDLKGTSNILNNIGVIYERNENTSRLALEYYLKSLAIEKQLNDLKGIGNRQNNLAVIYHNLGDYDKAKEYYNSSIETKTTNNDERGLMNTFHSLANLELEKENIKGAKELAEKSLVLAQKLALPYGIIQAAETLYEIYSLQKNWKTALEMHELYSENKDILIEESNSNETTQLQMQFEFDKKLAADSLFAVEEKKVIAERFRAEKTQRFALYGGLLLVAIFATFMYNRFKITKKQKEIIEVKEKETSQQKIIVEQQKHLIEEKHKEITDSINYAERIQRALLAGKKQLDNHLNDYFIFFKPKDVVSGDFYWAAKLHNNTFIVVVADSTGHGVPGAIMSILNISCLDKAITQQITAPDQILNETRKLIVENLKNDGSSEGGKDGMDCSLLSFDFEKKELNFASANNPVWIVREEGNATFQLLEFKADRMPVGKHDKDNTPFTLNTVTLKSGDTVYAFTDGFADQFGGTFGKKFKYKQLQELLLSVAAEPMQVQKEKLAEVFQAWKGELEQVDDVCVMGIRV